MSNSMEGIHHSHHNCQGIATKQLTQKKADALQAINCYSVEMPLWKLAVVVVGIITQSHSK